MNIEVFKNIIKTFYLNKQWNVIRNYINILKNNTDLRM